MARLTLVKRVLSTDTRLLEYSKKVGHDSDGNRVCRVARGNTGVTSEFIKSRYIPVKGGFNFSGIPIALTYIPAHFCLPAPSDLFETLGSRAAFPREKKK